jgi:hypothetical protein
MKQTLLQALCPLFLALLLVASHRGEPRASLYDTFGDGARGTAMGNSLVALSTTYDAVYYNPANVLARESNHFGIGLTGLVPKLRIDRVGPSDDALSYKLPQPNLGLQLGISVPLGGVFENKLGLAVVLFHPLLRVTRVESIDPSVPYFYRFQSLPNKLILSGAIAGKPWPWLRLGVGTQVLAELGGRITAGVSLSEHRVLSRTVDIDINAVAAPTAGMNIGPFHGLSLGLTWRGPLELRYRIPMTVDVQEIGILNFLADGVSLYTPGQIALGLAWQSAPGKDMGWSVELGVTWEQWSKAPPAGALFELHLDDSHLAAEDKPAEEFVSSTLTPIPLEAQDTLTPRVGLEYRPHTNWAFRTGYFWRPTPLPLPVYEANTLDAPAHVVSLGVGYMFKDPTEIRKGPLVVDLSIQGTFLHNRTVTKVAGYAPEGVYRGSGTLWNFALDLRHNY